MDPRLEYTFQLLIDATGLPRSEIMDNVFEGNMVIILHIALFTPFYINIIMTTYSFNYYTSLMLLYDNLTINTKIIEFKISVRSDQRNFLATYERQTHLVLPRS